MQAHAVPLTGSRTQRTPPRVRAIQQQPRYRAPRSPPAAPDDSRLPSDPMHRAATTAPSSPSRIYVILVPRYDSAEYVVRVPELVPVLASTSTGTRTSPATEVRAQSSKVSERIDGLAVGTRWQAPKQQLGAVSEQLSTAAAVCGPKDTQGTRVLVGPLGSLACGRWR